MGRLASSIRRCAVTALLLLAACTGGSSTGASVSPAPAPSEVSTTTLTPGGPFVRTCEASVYGDLGKDWRDHSVVVGPIAFVGLPGAATAPRRDFEPLGDGLRSVKALVVVDQGAEVTVAISPEDRAHVSLLYDPSAFKDLNAYSIADGEATVTFRACAKGEKSPVEAPDGPTQFNGGFVVDGPRCLTLDVLDAANGVLNHVNVAFGRGTCAAD